MDVEYLYQKMVLAFARAGVKKGKIALVFSSVRPEGYRFIGEDKSEDGSGFDAIADNKQYDLICVFTSKPDGMMPRYVDLVEQIYAYEQSKLSYADQHSSCFSAEQRFDNSGTHN